MNQEEQAGDERYHDLCDGGRRHNEGFQKITTCYTKGSRISLDLILSCLSNSHTTELQLYLHCWQYEKL
jgi:hypothetical protein